MENEIAAAIVIGAVLGFTFISSAISDVARSIRELSKAINASKEPNP